MRVATLSVALVAGMANAWTYPDCEPDNCYRQLTNEENLPAAEKFCPGYLMGTTTAAAAIPTAFNNCESDYEAVSSACSCITYSMKPTTSSSTAASTTLPRSTSPTTSASTSKPTSQGSSLPHSESKTAPVYTTSTIYATKVYTVTSCEKTVTDCPAEHKPYVTTKVIAITTTVCPVEEEEHGKPTTDKYYPKPTGTTTWTPQGTGAAYKPTTTGKAVVTAAAGRVAAALEVAAVAAAAAVVLL